MPRKSPASAAVALLSSEGLWPLMHNDFTAWLKQHEGRQYQLHAEHVNPVFVKMLKAIGFDKAYVRGEGCYLWDADGNKYLDLLTGWGVFALGRHHPKVKSILKQLID